MNGLNRLALVNVAFIVSITLTGVASNQQDISEDVVDAIVEKGRVERGVDYGTGVGGPVATGTDKQNQGGQETKGRKASSDECISISLDSFAERVPDSSNGQCTFHKKFGQELKLWTEKNGELGMKMLRIVACPNEQECIKLCVKMNCTYFTHYIRDERIKLAFLYSLDDRTLLNTPYTTAQYFVSYLRECHTTRTTPGRLDKALSSTSRPVVNRLTAIKLPDPLAFPNSIPFPQPGPFPPLPSISPFTFTQFVKTYKKSYSRQETRLRSNIFQWNVKRMDQLNGHIVKSALRDGAKYGLTPFADLTHQEFLNRYTGAVSGTEILSVKVNVTDRELENNAKRRPKRFDWRDQMGMVGPVRAQGACGACYAFTIADLVSAQNAIEKRQMSKVLAPQYVMDCYTGGNDAMGCKGGHVGKIIRHVGIDQKGLPLESCYQYKSTSGICRKNVSCCVFQKLKWSQTLNVSGPREKEIIAGLLQWGPLVTVIDASEAWQFHNGTGIIKSSQCSSRRQNHAVSLVGYNYEQGTPYYIVRNSWGKDWGNEGYAKLEAGTNACAVANTIVTACAYQCDRVKNANDILRAAHVFQNIMRSPATG